MSKKNPNPKNPRVVPAEKAPAGFKELVGISADVWKPKAKGEVIEGECTEAKLVKTTQGRKKTETVLMTLTDTDGSQNAVWVSANLKQKLGPDYKKYVGRVFRLIFMGTHKMKGKNPMKVFRVLEATRVKKR